MTWCFRTMDVARAFMMGKRVRSLRWMERPNATSMGYREGFSCGFGVRRCIL